MSHTKTLAALLVLFLCSCISYSNFPSEHLASLEASSKKNGTLLFAVDGNAMFAGPSAVRDVVVAESAYAKVIPAEVAPSEGLYLSVKMESLAPSIPAVVFGYISISTLTILPFWSTDDGSKLTFSLYRNAKLIDAKDYAIHRGTFVWLGMLPFAWVNLMTASETQAVAAATRDFMAKNSL